MGKILNSKKYYELDDSELDKCVNFLVLFEVLEFFTGDYIPVIAEYLRNSGEIENLNCYTFYENESHKIVTELVNTKYGDIECNSRFYVFIELMFENDDEDYNFLGDYEFDIEQFFGDTKYWDIVIDIEEFLELNCIKELGLDINTYYQTLQEMSKIRHDYKNYLIPPFILFNQPTDQTDLQAQIDRLTAENQRQADTIR